MLKKVLLLLLLVELRQFTPIAYDYNDCSNDAENDCLVKIDLLNVQLCEVCKSECPCAFRNVRLSNQVTNKSYGYNEYRPYASSDETSFPLNLVFSTVIIFILILMIVFGLICTCYCTNRRYCCCVKISNSDSSSSSLQSSETSVSDDQQNYVYSIENGPPPTYSHEMLKSSQKSEKLPDYNSLFQVKYENPT